LAHPETVTDAMNRLAQALVCLTDPAARDAYDAARPSRRATPSQAVAAVAEDEDDGRPLALAPPEPLPPVPALMRPARAAPRRDGAGRAPYRRLAAARRLLAAWRDAGRFLEDPARRLRRPAEAVELVGTLWDLRGRLADAAAPPVGPPGQPGALVAALARQPLPLHTYRHLLPEQRTTLASDWRAGLDRLAAAHWELQRAARRHRRRAPRRAVARAARALVTSRLDLTLFVLGLAALGLAVLRSR
jgi:hypothetical protein